ncbi:hypothetical protein A2232_07660 [candidate division WOR-1 bacterium RIFOXYA2_FULL_46_56]|nr:MAG: hypothetical protein A2232_07660 [candidate division WOR-1 bacterium RIFOXYA2_FULL_46_56]
MLYHYVFNTYKRKNSLDGEMKKFIKGISARRFFQEYPSNREGEDKRYSQGAPISIGAGAR